MVLPFVLIALLVFLCLEMELLNLIACRHEFCVLHLDEHVHVSVHGDLTDPRGSS